MYTQTPARLSPAAQLAALQVWQPVEIRAVLRYRGAEIPVKIVDVWRPPSMRSAKAATVEAIQGEPFCWMSHGGPVQVSSLVVHVSSLADIELVF
jgi:hypothetical protein